MALWPNNRRDLLGFSPVRHTAHLGFSEHQARTERRVAYFVNGQIARTSSIPEGHMGGAIMLVLPIKAGGMAAARNETALSLTGTANLLRGGPMQGAGTITMTAAAALALTVSMSATWSGSLTGSASMAATLGMSGTWTGTLTGTGALAMIVPLGQATGTLSLTGTANLKGRLSLSGEWTPFTELSPENLARRVWEYLIEGDETAEQALRILLARAAGNATGLDGPAVAFKSRDGSKTRLGGTISGGSRTVTTRDGT